MATNGSNLYVVNLFCFEVAVISIVISDSSQEFNISKQLSRVTLTQLQVSNDEIVIVDIFHGNCGCRSIECTLILICVIDLQAQVDGLGIENLLIDAARRILCLDKFLTQIDTLNHDNLTVDELVAWENVE